MNHYRIYENGEEINTIVADEAFVTAYCAKNSYTFEEYQMPPEPIPAPEATQLDIIEAQVAYTAMMTNTLLEV